jgi:tetratricopeptide (TPR) repeat protein
MLQSKPQWAERFYDRALRADPGYGLAELGKARLAKNRKDQTAYLAHLKKARQLDPANPLIREECKKAGI